jgi:hypothetical protein
MLNFQINYKKKKEIKKTGQVYPFFSWLGGTPYSFFLNDKYIIYKNIEKV